MTEFMSEPPAGLDPLPLPLPQSLPLPRSRLELILDGLISISTDPVLVPEIDPSQPLSSQTAATTAAPTSAPTTNDYDSSPPLFPPPCVRKLILLLHGAAPHIEAYIRSSTAYYYRLVLKKLNLKYHHNHHDAYVNRIMMIRDVMIINTSLSPSLHQLLFRSLSFSCSSSPSSSPVGGSGCGACVWHHGGAGTTALCSSLHLPQGNDPIININKE